MTTPAAPYPEMLIPTWNRAAVQLQRLGFLEALRLKLARRRN
jgi:hypothetical protein